jgi:HEAT repeat protein
MARIEDLVQQLGTGVETATRTAAQQALQAMGADAVQPLINALASSDVILRRSAVGMLANFNDQRAVIPVRKALYDPEIQSVAAMTLGTLGDKESAAEIKRLLFDVATRETNKGFMLKALEQLLRRAETLKIATELLTDKYSNVIHQMVMQQVIFFKDPATVDLLIATARKKEFSVAYSAIDGLVNLKDERGVDFLIELLEDESPQWRAKAVHALGMIGSERAIEPLKQLLHDNAIVGKGDYPGEPDTTVAMTVRDALKRLGQQSTEDDSSASKPWWKVW